MGSIRFLALGCVVLLLAACGGGGGGGGGPRAVGNFTIATSTVTFEGDPSGGAPAPAVVTGSITGVNQTVFLTVVVTSNGIANATVAVTSETTGALTIFPKHPAQLGFGTFSDTVTVSACLDTACGQHISGSPRTVNVTYNVRSLTVAPTSVTLTATEGLASPPSQVTLTNNTTANWTSSITYQGAATGWLTLTPATAATQGAQQVTFNASALNTPGSYSATVQITAGSRTRNIPVTYNVSPNLSPSQAAVTLTAVTGQIAPPVVTNLGIAAPRAATFATSVSYAPGASNWLAVTGTAAPGSIGLVPQTVALTPGSYQATVTLTPNIGTPVQVAVTYTLAPSALTFTPANPLFTINAASTATAPFLQRTVATGDTGAPLTWTASTGVPWLTVTPAGASGQNALLTIVSSQLQSMRNGPHRVNVTFTYNGPAVVNQTRALAVDLALSLPTLEYAMPHVAYLNEGKELVLRGSGFAQPGGAAVTFDGTPAATAQVVSDTELRVTPPAAEVAGASRPQLTIANSLNLDRSDVEIVVRAKPAYGTTQLDNGNVTLPTGWRVLYDAERDLVFGSRAFSFGPPNTTLDSVMRFALDPTGAAPPTFTFKQYPGLNDIALSPDGRTLYVATGTELHFVDPVTMNDIKPPVSMPALAGGVGRMAVINDGRILLPHLQRFYSPQTSEFELLGEPLGNGLTEVSADGSRVALQREAGNGLYFLGTFDASTNEFEFMTEERGSQVVSLDRTGTLIAAGGDVFNADLTAYGVAAPSPDSANFSRLSPAGDRLYALHFGAPNQVRVFDTSAPATSFPELTPTDVLFGASGMGISLNGEHVFIIAEGTFFVVEP